MSSTYIFILLRLESKDTLWAKVQVVSVLCISCITDYQYFFPLIVLSMQYMFVIWWCVVLVCGCRIDPYVQRNVIYCQYFKVCITLLRFSKISFCSLRVLYCLVTVGHQLKHSWWLLCVVLYFCCYVLFDVKRQMLLWKKKRTRKLSRNLQKNRRVTVALKWCKFQKDTKVSFTFRE